MLFKYAKKSFNEYFFKKYILEDTLNKELMINLLSKKGTFLLIAPAGAGKTYGTIKSIKKLIEEDTTRKYIIACPNRIQNEQNSKQYKIKALVGGVNSNGELIISTVYDKCDEIEESLKEFGDKELVLIIDEAHSLVSAKNYRPEAIKKLKELSEAATTVIHMTATYRKLLKVYEYDYKAEFISTSSEINNISQLSIIDTHNVKETILSQIRIQRKKNKLPVVLINDKDLLQEYKLHLESKGLSVSVLDTDSKNGYVFNHIAEKELVPELILDDDIYMSMKKDIQKTEGVTLETVDILNRYKKNNKKCLTDIALRGVDVLLTTTVIEVGTNLKNTNLALIYAVINSRYFDIDSVIQFFARAREKIDDAILLTPRQQNKETQRYKTVNTYIDEIIETAEKDMLLVNELADFLSSRFYSNDVEKYLNSFLKVKQSSGMTLSKGVISVENSIPFIDKVLVINKAFNLYDKQLLCNLNALKEILTTHVKADKIVCMTLESLKALEEENSIDSAKDELKALNEISASHRELKRANVKDTLIRLYKFKEYELCEVLCNKQDPVNFGYAFNKDFKVIQSDSSIYKLLKKSLKQDLSIEMALAIIIGTETITEAQNLLKEITYINFNKIIPFYYYDDKVVRDDYSVIRKHIDDIIGTRRKITSKLIYKICDDFKKIKTYKKEIKNYEKYLALAIKNKKSSLSASEKKDFIKTKDKHKAFEKLLIEEIKLLYILDEDSYPIDLRQEIPQIYIDILENFKSLVNNYKPQPETITSHQTNQHKSDDDNSEILEQNNKQLMFI